MFQNGIESGRPAEQPILVAMDLRKSYGPRPALKGLSFRLAPGRILGFLGPNGAGKTTAIRILTTMMEPDTGTFIVDGIRSDRPDAIRRRIGVLPESLGFHKHMTGIEWLTFFGLMYGLPKYHARSRATDLLEEVGLEQRGKSEVGTYSRGMRQRLGIARTLMNEPVAVFLDEPTLGLDPRGQQELLELILRIAKGRRVGVVLCSHALAEVESVCDDVIILSSGQVVASGTAADVIGHTSRDVMKRNAIRIQVSPEATARAQRTLTGVAGVAEVTQTGESAGWLRVDLLSIEGAPSDARPVNNRLLEALIRAEIPVLNLETEGGRLQEVFLHLTERVIR